MRLQISLMISAFLCFMSCVSANEKLPYPYDSLKEVLPFDDFGWYYAAEPIEKIIKEKNVRVVIELGSWLGKSTRHIATTLPEDGVIYAVDHWRGSQEHFDGSCDYLPNLPKLLPVLYEQFLSNVIHANLTHKIVPMRMSTLEAVKKFQEMHICPGLIYVDASHDEQSVYEDLAAYYPFVKGHGTLCGDDWGWGESDGFPVRKAVLRFAKEHNLQIQLFSDDWVWVLSDSPIAS